jgi:hypothetical protein
VLKFLSHNTIVIAPASTGRDNNNKIAVTNIAHVNNGTLCQLSPGFLMLIIVVIKFMAPSKELIPAKCSENITKSTDPPLWLCTPLKG